MFLHLIKDSLKKKQGRKLLVLLSIALGASVTSGFLIISLDIGDKMGRELKSYGANIVILPETEAISLAVGDLEISRFKKKSYIDEKKLPLIKEIFWTNNILGFVPYLTEFVSFNSKRIPLIGTWFEKEMVLDDGSKFSTGSRKIYPYWKIEGDFPREPREILVGEDLARRFSIKKGERLKFDGIEEMEFYATGILSTGGEEDREIFALLETVQEIGQKRGKLDKIEVSALTTPENDIYRQYLKDPQGMTEKDFETWFCTPYVSSISFQLKEAIGMVEAKPIRQVSESEGKIIRRIRIMMLVIALVAIFTSALGIMSTLNTTILERRKEIGLLKAIGAKDLNIIFLLGTETLALGFLGGILGYLFGVFLSQVLSLSLFGVKVGLNLLVIPLVLLVSLVIVALGSLFPVLKVLEIDPSVVLHEE